jgi:hypothetical protein
MLIKIYYVMKTPHLKIEKLPPLSGGASAHNKQKQEREKIYRNTSLFFKNTTIVRNCYIHVAFICQANVGIISPFW